MMGGREVEHAFTPGGGPRAHAGRGVRRNIERTTTSTPQPEPSGKGGGQPATCSGRPLRVVFFDAGQALAALVTLPDGKHILVDAGESPTRPQCGAPCKDWHQRVMAGLAREFGDAPIDLAWITHPHSDHIGGAVDVLDPEDPRRTRRSPCLDRRHRAGPHDDSDRDERGREARRDRSAALV